jgi:hypothetical protein
MFDGGDYHRAFEEAIDNLTGRFSIERIFRAQRHVPPTARPVISGYDPRVWVRRSLRTRYCRPA